MRLQKALVLIPLVFSFSKLPAQTRQATPAVTSTAVTTTGGTTNYLPKFTGTATLGNSIIYDNGTDVGIGIIPNGNAKLDLNGAMILRGLMTVSRTGNATTAKGYPSWGFDFYSNVYNSSSKATVNPFFQLQSEPTGNNTASPGATLNFLYSATGNGLDETGLYFNPNGTIHFASTQTFPIAQGPAGPTGPTGPAGPKGATGAQGPAGPALSFPYSATVTSGTFMFQLENSGNGGVANFIASDTAGAVLAIGGGSGTAQYSQGGVGVNAIGGGAAGTETYGGPGGFFVGGTSPSGGYQAGDGLYAVGGSASTAGNGGYAIYATAGSNGSYAAYFGGNVFIGGNLAKSGGSFKIDDPEDPANKYLSHSFVESPDMMNIYNGNVVTDGSGTAVVTMPTYFESLNRDFRYQLTVIGQFAQAIVGSKISNAVFIIKTDKPNVEVSWMVTGIRQDAWANAHRIPTEEEKSEKEKGHYLNPELFGHPEDASIAERAHPRPNQRKAATSASQ